MTPELLFKVGQRPVDDIIETQKAYYRARAAEYDQWWLRQGRYALSPDNHAQWDREKQALFDTFDSLGSVEYAVELACGTGNWTKRLVNVAKQVTALDASTEMLAITRAKVDDASVVYQQVDLFEWEPQQQYDLLVACFWLSHVPTEHLTSHLSLMRRAVKPNGRLFLVDAQPYFRNEHTYRNVEQEAYEQRRQINDGREFVILKRYFTQAELVDLLQAAGFNAEVHLTPKFFWMATA